MRSHAGKVLAPAVLISVLVLLFITPVVSAQKSRNIVMLGLIQRIDRQSRHITLWEYRTGDSTWTLQVPGSEDMRRFQVGDYVQVIADSSRRVALRTRKLPPPKDERYQDAVRRLEAETGEWAR